MSELRVAPEELMAMANNIAEKAEEMSELIKKLDAKIETVKSGWDGMSANAMYNSYVGMRESLQQFPQVILGIASQAQTAAKVYDETDSELASALQG